MIRSVSRAFLAFHLVKFGHAKSYFFLTSQSPRCATVEVPSATFVHVTYDVPDLHHPNDSVVRKKQTILTISQTDAVGANHGRHPRRGKAHTSTTVLERTAGKILYETEVDGTVQVCIRAQGASTDNPIRVSLMVATGLDSLHYKHQEMEHHLSKLQVALMKLTDDMGGILREADMAKTREVEFHNLSVSMHAASQWWPILQLLVLLATGFTQVKAMVQFFKTKHLV